MRRIVGSAAALGPLLGLLLGLYALGEPDGDRARYVVGVAAGAHGGRIVVVDTGNGAAQPTRIRPGEPPASIVDRIVVLANLLGLYPKRIDRRTVEIDARGRIDGTGIRRLAAGEPSPAVPGAARPSLGRARPAGRTPAHRPSTFGAFNPCNPRGHWIRLRDLPSPHRPVAVAVAGRVCAVGGEYAPGVPARAMECRESGRDSWDQMAPGAPEDRSRFAAVGLPGGRIALLGGVSHDGRPISALEIFDVGKGAWTNARPMPTPRFDLAAVYDPAAGRIYAIGGSNGASALDSVESYDLKSDAWHPEKPLSVARGGLGAAIVDGTIFAIGGYTSSSDLFQNHTGVVETYDPRSRGWVTPSGIPPLPLPRASFGIAALGGSIYVLGGSDDDRPSRHTSIRDVEALTPRFRSGSIEGRWRQLTRMPTARDGLSAVAWAGGIDAIGGTKETRYLTTVERFIPPIGPLPDSCRER